MGRSLTGEVLVSLQSWLMTKDAKSPQEMIWEFSSLARSVPSQRVLLLSCKPRCARQLGSGFCTFSRLILSTEFLILIAAPVYRPDTPAMHCFSLRFPVPLFFRVASKPRRPQQSPKALLRCPIPKAHK